MKKARNYFLILLFMLLAVSAGIFLSGCFRPAPRGPEIFTVSFNTNGGSEKAHIYFGENSIPNLGSNPEREGWFFNGWFEDEDLTVSYRRISRNQSFTLYAAWADTITISSTNFNSFFSNTITHQIGTGNVVGNILFLPDANVRDLRSVESITVRVDIRYFDERQQGSTLVASGSTDIQLNRSDNFTRENISQRPTGNFPPMFMYTRREITITIVGSPKIYSTGLAASQLRQFTLSFETNLDNLEKHAILFYEGEVISGVESLSSEGLFFDGWFIDEDLTTRFSSATHRFFSDRTLYARWLESVELTTTAASFRESFRTSLSFNPTTGIVTGNISPRIGMYLSNPASPSSIGIRITVTLTNTNNNQTRTGSTQTITLSRANNFSRQANDFVIFTQPGPFIFHNTTISVNSMAQHTLFFV